MSRYHVSCSEGQYEKDSGEQILANKLGIAASDEMDEAELVLLEQLYQSVFEEQFPEGQLSVAMLKSRSSLITLSRLVLVRNNHKSSSCCEVRYSCTRSNYVKFSASHRWLKGYIGLSMAVERCT
ncbi:hypothetical protein AW40_26535 [Kosakonia radicincitans UMEnt01/12]|nr:hypothetical protein AW40_26535 [Kosakonia radicincitans UMEnt01/12]